MVSKAGVLLTLTLQGFNVYIIYSQCSTASFPSLVASKVRILIKINLLTCKTRSEKQRVHLDSMLATSLPPVQWDPTMITVCQSLGPRLILVQELFNLVPRLSVQPFQLLPSEETSLWLGRSPIIPLFPLLMLRHWYIELADEHWFSCRTTEPGFAGDIGANEVWLIDWLISQV